MPAIPALRRLKQEDLNFEVRLCFKKKQKRREKESLGTTAVHKN
jgi:hypothetical protein